MTIEWPITDVHTLERTLKKEDLEKNTTVCEALLRYTGWKCQEGDEPDSEHVEPDQDADMRDRNTVREWLEVELQEAMEQAAHALARTIVWDEKEKMFIEDPPQETVMYGSDGYRPQDCANDEWEEMIRPHWGKTIPREGSKREAARKGAERSIAIELTDWLDGEGEGMWQLGDLVQ